MSTKRLTTAQSRILGYIISSQTTPESGVTIREIVEATGLGHNTVYTYMRNGIPGVMQSRIATPTGSKMYYVTTQSLAAVESQLNDLPKLGPITWRDTDMWSAMPERFHQGIESTINKEPASVERINDIIQSMLSADSLEVFAVGGQSIAALAIELIGKQVKA